MEEKTGSKRPILRDVTKLVLEEPDIVPVSKPIEAISSCNEKAKQSETNQPPQNQETNSTVKENSMFTKKNGDGGGDGSGGWSPGKVFALVICVVCITALVCFVMFSSKSNFPGTEIQKMETLSGQSKAKMEINKAVERPAQPESVKAVSNHQDKPSIVVNITNQQQTKSKTLSTITSVNCPTGKDNDAYTKEFFVSLHTQQLNADNSTRVTPGCSKVIVTGEVTDLKGSGYLLGVPVQADNPDPKAEWFKCGTYAGQSDSKETCVGYLNLHAGEAVYIGLKNDGYLTIN